MALPNIPCYREFTVIATSRAHSIGEARPVPGDAIPGLEPIGSRGAACWRRTHESSRIPMNPTRLVISSAVVTARPSPVFFELFAARGGIDSQVNG